MNTETLARATFVLNKSAAEDLTYLSTRMGQSRSALVREILPAPASVVPWVAHGEGFAVDHPAALSPVERLQRRFVDSSDVADLIRLAASFDGGVDYLCHQIRKRAQAVDPTRTGTH